MVLFGADYGLIYWGEQFLDSGLTAILFATLPLITVAFAHLYIPGNRITARKLTGTLLAFVGVVALFGESLQVNLNTLGPMVAIIVAAVCAAAAGVASKRHGSSLHAAALNAPAMLVGGIVLAVVAIASGEGLRVPSDAKTWAGNQLSRDRGQRGDLPDLLFAAEDVERDEPQLHQRVHAGDCARTGVRVSR